MTTIFRKLKVHQHLEFSERAAKYCHKQLYSVDSIRKITFNEFRKRMKTDVEKYYPMLRIYTKVFLEHLTIVRETKCYEELCKSRNPANDRNIIELEPGKRFYIKKPRIYIEVLDKIIGEHNIIYDTNATDYTYNIDSKAELRKIKSKIKNYILSYTEAEQDFFDN